MDSNSEIQGYNMYPMLHFHRKFSSGVIPRPRLQKRPGPRSRKGNRSRLFCVKEGVSKRRMEVNIKKEEEGEKRRVER